MPLIPHQVPGASGPNARFARTMLRVRAPIALRACYAMSGTDLAVAAASLRPRALTVLISAIIPGYV
eukprot:204254-Rhodomonas_salina.1